MRRSRTAIAIGSALIAIALILAACGGGDDDETTTTTAPAGVDEGAPSPSAGGLPPGLLECFADKGYELESSAEIHSAPPQVVQECFGALHQSGGGP